MGNIIGTNTDWGFTAGDLWSNGMSITTSLAGFIILGIAVAFAPRIISLIKTAVVSRGGTR